MAISLGRRITRLEERIFAPAGSCDIFSGYCDDPVRFGEDVLGERYTDDIKTMMKSVCENSVTVAQSANATGKTHGAARVALWFFLAFPDSQVYAACAPPEANLNRILWAEIMSVVYDHPRLFEGMTVTKLSISRSPRSFLVGTSIPMAGTPQQREAKFSGKHAPNLMFLFDEGDAVPDECYQGAESCMSGGNAKMLVMFNPRHESGHVYRMARDRRAHRVRLSAFCHPNVITGVDKIPGAVSRQITVRRINEWTRPLAAGEPEDTRSFELPAYLVGAAGESQAGKSYPPLQAGRYRIVEPAFSYMVLGIYPAQAETMLISRAWIDSARSRYDAYVAGCGEQPPDYAQAIAGFDVAEYGNDSTVLCLRYGVLVLPLIAWGGSDILESSDRCARLCAEKRVSIVNTDATGVGSGVAPSLQRKGIVATPFKVASKPTMETELGEFAILRDQLWWSLREWLRTDKAMLPPDELLIEELLTPTYEVINGKITIMKKKMMRNVLKRSPDRADALVLTFSPQGFFSECDLL